MGTVAGNLCNASPAADGVPVLMALGAEVVLRSGEGERRCPVVDFALGSRRTACAPHELVVALEVPARSSAARSVFRKLGGRRYLTISMTMVAVALDVDGAGVVAHAGVAVGSCSAVARRLPALERRLIGRPLAHAPDQRLAGGRLAGALEDLVEPADLAPLTPIDDLRASAAYRLDASATLLRRALRELRA